MNIWIETTDTSNCMTVTAAVKDVKMFQDLEVSVLASVQGTTFHWKKFFT